MAGLKVFVSSTSFDLKAHRSQLHTLLVRMGYDPIMSDYSDVLYDHRLHTHTSCIKEVPDADMVILLVGSRFGGTAIPEAVSEIEFDQVSKASSRVDILSEREKISITQLEVIKAIESNIPVFAFVDSKVLNDHHVYQTNKGKDYSSQIIYPSIQKPETSKYIFQFIDLLTHRFTNNALMPFSSVSEIETHLLKQWSLLFQRLLREERDKTLEARRADVMIDQIQDLKAAVLQSISSGSAREAARNVLRFRRLADFLISLRIVNPQFAIGAFDGSFDELLTEFGVEDVIDVRSAGAAMRTTVLVLRDDTHVRVRMPFGRFQQFHVEWADFVKLEADTRAAVLDGVAGSDSSSIRLAWHVLEPYQEEAENYARILPTFEVPTLSDKIISEYLSSQAAKATALSQEAAKLAGQE